MNGAFAEETVMACFKVLLHYLFARTMENHRKNSDVRCGLSISHT